MTRAEGVKHSLADERALRKKFSADFDAATPDAVAQVLDAHEGGVPTMGDECQPCEPDLLDLLQVDSDDECGESALPEPQRRTASMPNLGDEVWPLSKESFSAFVKREAERHFGSDWRGGYSTLGRCARVELRSQMVVGAAPGFPRDKIPTKRQCSSAHPGLCWERDGLVYDIAIGVASAIHRHESQTHPGSFLQFAAGANPGGREEYLVEVCAGCHRKRDPPISVFLRSHRSGDRLHLREKDGHFEFLTSYMVAKHLAAYPARWFRRVECKNIANEPRAVLVTALGDAVTLAPAARAKDNHRPPPVSDGPSGSYDPMTLMSVLDQAVVSAPEEEQGIKGARNAIQFDGQARGFPCRCFLGRNLPRRDPFADSRSACSSCLDSWGWVIL